MAGKRQRFPNSKSSKSLQFLEAFANQSPTYRHANLHLLFLRDSIPVCSKPTKKGTKWGYHLFNFNVTSPIKHETPNDLPPSENHHFYLHKKKTSRRSLREALRCVALANADPSGSEGLGVCHPFCQRFHQASVWFKFGEDPADQR